jgi:hypothetical protein
MSQENTPSEERPQPRYQPPSVTPGASTFGNSTNGARPSDWPAPNRPPEAGQGAWGGYQPGTPGNTGYGYTPGYGYAPPEAGKAYYPVPPEDPQAAAYKRAAKLVDEKIKFYKHLTTYLIINGFLWFIALATVPSGVPLPGRIWPIWITVFWGIGLASQWWRVFGTSEQRRQQMIEEELRRMRR